MFRAEAEKKEREPPGGNLSTVFEGYAWSLSSVSGLGLVLLGNGLVLGIKLPFTRHNKA